jgi:hypothetical protein
MTPERDEGEPSPKRPAVVRCEYFDAPVDVYYSGLDSLEHLPDRPGWYCWIYVPVNEDDLSAAVCRAPTVLATVEGPLGLDYAGRIRPRVPDLGRCDEHDLENVRRLMLAFAPPLYIGMATRLRARLLSHRKHILTPGATTELKSEELDTETESAFFGRRIADLLRDNGIRRESLIVKCIVSVRGSRAALKAPETTLNRMYSPPHGRKA